MSDEIPAKEKWRRAFPRMVLWFLVLVAAFLFIAVMWGGLRPR